MKHTWGIFCIFLLTTILGFSKGKKNPKEIGHVSWGRDYDQALATAKQKKKPIFALFQEVPG